MSEEEASPPAPLQGERGDSKLRGCDSPVLTIRVIRVIRVFFTYPPFCPTDFTDFVCIVLS